MIQYSKTPIRQYENFIRDILNSSVRRINWEKLEEKGDMFADKIQSLFKTENSMSWSFYCSSLDAVGDSTMAIVSFQNYRFKRGNEVTGGEQYLRLYGLLNAVYINYGALMSLAELVKIKNADIETTFKNTKIYFLRNALAAHPTNFNENGRTVNYKVARFSLENERQLVVINSSNKFVDYDLNSSINEYISLAESLLYKVCSKIVQLRYGSNKSKISNLLEELDKIKSTASNTMQPST